MIEGTMTIPIIMLTVLSLILLMIFYYTCLKAQVDVHEKLSKKICENESVFQIAKEQESTSSKMGGVTTLLMNKKFSSRVYLIRESEILRAGEFIDELKK